MPTPAPPAPVRLPSVNSWVNRTSQPLDQYSVTLHIEATPFIQAFQLLPEDEGFFWVVFFFFAPQSRPWLRRTLGNSLNYVLITTQLALPILGGGGGHVCKACLSGLVNSYVDQPIYTVGSTERASEGKAASVATFRAGVHQASL